VVSTKPKPLGVICLSGRSFDLFSRQIYEFYGDRIRIEGFCVERGMKHLVEAEHVLVSHPSILDSVREFVRPSARLFSCRRTVDLAAVIPLFHLPSGTRVVVANNTPEAASETVGLLQELGLDHLAFVPHWPGKEDAASGARVVVVPGVEPRSFGIAGALDNVIDIGVRPLDLSTIVEIGVRLDLPLDKANMAAMRRAREVVALTRKQRSLVERLNDANERLKVVIDSVNDGIIGVDSGGAIILINEVARKMLGLKHDVTGSPAGILPGQIGTLPAAATEDGDSGRLMEMGARHVLVSRVAIPGSAGSVIIMRDVTEIQRIEHNVRQRLRDRGFVAKYSFDDIIGSSAKLRRAVEVARKLAATDLTVLILGENGTGKELFAHAIHRASAARDGPFIAVNFSAFPENLVESELFGYEEGAFTGARKGGKQGLFEQAHNGTIFLDEVGDLPPSVQVRLLRVLQERDIMRIGATRVTPVNVRVIAASNKDLLTLVREGRFRQDLYYRMCVSPLRVPPLRERREDIDLLVRHFLSKYGGPESFPESVMEALRAHDWPGNVRELEGVARYLVSIAGSDGSRMEEMLADLFPRHRGSFTRDGGADEVCARLSRKAPLQEFRAILSSLARARSSRERRGRGSILTSPEVAALGLTQQMVRHRLKALEEVGLVAIGRGRQGTWITADGARYLARFSESHTE
jgi:transcriptional regulator with PAS, ATPase and Fis domain